MFRAHRPIFRRVRSAVHTTIGCVNSCTNSPEDGPVGLKHVEIQQYTNKIVTSVGFHSICQPLSYSIPFILLFLLPNITYPQRNQFTNSCVFFSIQYPSHVSILCLLYIKQVSHLLLSYICKYFTLCGYVKVFIIFYKYLSIMP